MDRLYATRYAQSREYPVQTILRLCRAGTIPALRVGRKYLIDTEAADAVMQEHEYTEKYTPRQRQAIAIEQTRAAEPVRKKNFNFLEELRKAR